MSLTPLELITSLVPSMSGEDKLAVKKALGDAVTKCDLEGHKYKKIGEKPALWFFPPKAIMCCERCGHRLEV